MELERFFMSEKVSMMKGMSGHGAYMLIRMSVSDHHEIEELMQAWRIANAPAPEPDMFWDSESPEEETSLDEIASNNSPLSPKSLPEVVQVLCALRLPSKKMQVWLTDDDETRWEWVD